MTKHFRPLLKYIYHNSTLAQYYWLKLDYAKQKNTMHMCDVEYAKMMHRKISHRELNLTNPVTFDDKLWYLKLSNRDPLLVKCSDKYLVREYVEECGLGHILNELYGVYANARDINFDKLPSPCFLKCNHTSGCNIIFDRNKPFNRRDFIRKFNFTLKQNYYVKSREWNYKNIETRIICERVLKDEKTGGLPYDYKFLCFGGVPKLLVVNIGGCQEDGQHARTFYRNIYDMNFNLLEMKDDLEVLTDGSVICPDNFELMKEYAAILAKPFPHCRVDLYNIDGKIYFGEITFYHGGGNNDIKPAEWAVKMGEWIDVSGYKIAEDAQSTNPRR